MRSSAHFEDGISPKLEIHARISCQNLLDGTRRSSFVFRWIFSEIATSILRNFGRVRLWPRNHSQYCRPF